MKIALYLLWLASLPGIVLAQLSDKSNRTYAAAAPGDPGAPTPAYTSRCVTLLAEGPTFPEPADGIARLLQLRNGNTLFVHFSGQEGLQVQLYNAARALQDSTLRGFRATSLDAAFETAGHVTVLISDRSTKRPLLIRLQVSGETGRLLRQDTVAYLHHINLRKRKVTTSSDFLVIKDPYSGNYAVWMYYNTADEQDGGYEVVHFGEDHREISRARFSGSGDGRRFRYWDMAVIGDKMLCILGTEQNALLETASSEMKLATLDSGNIFFRFKDLGFPKGLAIQGGLIKHHPARSELLLLQAAVNDAKKTSTWLGTVALDSMAVAVPREVIPARVNEKQKELFGAKAPYDGVPQNVIIKPSGGYSIIFEELDNHMRLMNGTPVVVSTILANLAVMDFDADGKEQRSWLIPKRQMNPGLIMKAFYQRNRENATDRLHWADQYKFFTHIPGRARDYIFINDLAENNERVLKGQLAVMRDAREAQGFYYALEGSGVVPSRGAVFDAGSPVALFTISDYRTETGTLVTVKRAVGDRRQVQLVWLEVH